MSGWLRCPHCKSPVEPNAEFCQECGANLTVGTGPTRMLARQPQRASRLPFLGLIGSIVLLVLGVGLGMLLAGRRAQQTVAVVQPTNTPVGAVCAVPNVVGEDQSAAVGQIGGIGLQPVKSANFDTSVPIGTIISQDPPAGSQVNSCQGKVSIVVSLGPLPTPTVPAPTPTLIPPSETPTDVPPTITATPNPPTETPTPMPPTTTPTPAPTDTPEPKAGDILYQSDWSKGMNGWSGSGDWQTVNGMMVTNGPSSQRVAVFAPYDPDANTSYAIEAEIKIVQQHCGVCLHQAGVLARAQQQNDLLNAYMFGVTDPLGGSSVNMNTIEVSEDPHAFQYQFVPIGGDWHTYRAEIRGNSYQLLLDGNIVLKGDDNTFLSGGHVGLFSIEVAYNVRSFKVIKL